MIQRDVAASDMPDLGKPFCTRCHKWGHRYTECPEPQRPESPARKLWRLAVGEIRRGR